MNMREFWKWFLDFDFQVQVFSRHADVKDGLAGFKWFITVKSHAIEVPQYEWIFRRIVMWRAHTSQITMTGSVFHNKPINWKALTYIRNQKQVSCQFWKRKQTAKCHVKNDIHIPFFALKQAETVGVSLYWGFVDK